MVDQHPTAPSTSRTGSQLSTETVMSDDKKKVGKPDRDRVSGKEKYEVDYLVKKHELPAPLVKKIIEQVGPMRKDVDKYLEQMKKNGK